MKLIVGLGNPGRHYANNRHNVGFACLSHFAKTQGIQFDKKQGRARTGRGQVAGDDVVVARPQTYMNLSGQSVGQLMKKFSINLDDLVVVHDDMDIPLGKIRIRRGGGSAGHKGLASVITYLKSPDFTRIRIGIGRPAKPFTEVNEDEIIAYVLSGFSTAEKQSISQVIPRVSEAILCLITQGLIEAMNEYN